MLPYWDYEDRAQRKLPPLFGDPEMQDGAPTNPLFEFFRDDRLKQGGELTQDSVSIGDMNDKSQYFGVGLDAQFAGSPLSTRDATGAIEDRPHNRMHGALGGTVTTPTGPQTGYMASVATAAFDPIFWIHHTNVDRLWMMWDCNIGKDWGRLPSRGWFNQNPWLFHAPDGSEIREPRQFYIEDGVLPVTYDNRPPGCKPLSSRIPVLISAAENLAAEAPQADIVLAAATILSEVEGPGMLQLDAPSSTTLTVPGAGAEATMDLSTLGAGLPERVLLDFLQISFKYAPSVRYDVYVNPDGDAELVHESPAYVGSIDFFGLSAHEIHHAKGAVADGLSTSFDVTDQVASGASMADITVRIVAEDQVTLPDGAERFSGEVQVGKMRLRRVSVE